MTTMQRKIWRVRGFGRLRGATGVGYWIDDVFEGSDAAGAVGAWLFVNEPLASAPVAKELEGTSIVR